MSPTFHASGLDRRAFVAVAAGAAALAGAPAAAQVQQRAPKAAPGQVNTGRKEQSMSEGLSKARLARMKHEEKSILGRKPAAVLGRFVAEAQSALLALSQSAHARELEAATGILAKARDIYLLGLGGSFPVATHLAYVLRKLGRRVVLLDGIGGSIHEQSHPATSASVLSTTPDLIASWCASQKALNVSSNEKPFARAVAAPDIPCRRRSFSNNPKITSHQSPASFPATATPVMGSGRGSIRR